MIIAVGFKVNSERAVQFRKWVNQIAKDYTISSIRRSLTCMRQPLTMVKKYVAEHNVDIEAF